MRPPRELTCCEILLSIICSPIGYLCHFGCDIGFFINTLLWFLTLTLFSTIHLNCKYGLDICTSLLCELLPFVAVCLKTGDCCKSLICFLLMCLGIIPGILYAYVVCHEHNYKQDLKRGYGGNT